MIGTAVAYVTGTVAWWIAVPVAAIFMAIAHEIEHDAIHRLYFAGNKRAQHVMFAVAGRRARTRSVPGHGSRCTCCTTRCPDLKRPRGAGHHQR